MTKMYKTNRAERRATRRWWVAAVMVLLLLGAPLALAAARPNVLLIMTDDQGYGDLACNGNPVIKTPVLDKLHDMSIRLTNFHVSPTCAPTRAALMTGRYTDETGSWHTIMGRELMNRHEVTMAQYFRAAGYRTALFGKWHLGDNYPFRPQDRGFDEVVMNGGGGVHQTPDYFGNDYADDTYYHNGKPQKYSGFCTDVWFANAMNFMADAQRRGVPFFCYLPTNAPHGPYWAPDSYTQMYVGVKGLANPGFYGMITNIDDNMAKMLKFLKDKGLEENTILIFMSDNGSAAGYKVFNSHMRGHKGSPYDGGHRVPFFIRWPAGGLVGPRDIDTLTAHIDVLPTLIDFCGLGKLPGPPIHGRSLRALLEGKKPSWNDRVIVVDSQRLDDLVHWRHTSVMTQRWRLVNPTGDDSDLSKLELYDIHKDPGQNDNVASQYPYVFDQLKTEYEKWWKMASARANEYSRIVLGDDADNPTRLTSHDWHGNGSLRTWNQTGIRKAPAANGWWAVTVEKEGDYQFDLRRWPTEVGLPVNAPYHDKTPNRDKTPGRAIHAEKARLKVAGFDRTIPVKATDTGAVFTVHLKKGPAKVETWFFDKDGSVRGAYYTYVKRL